MNIIGAGLAGLLCGALSPGRHTIYEAQGQLPNNHGAVLRFRSDEISRALGIPFKKVTVYKAIWFGGKEMDPTPRMQNYYSDKVLHEFGSRSIRDISPVTRWIAPTDFTYQLSQRCNIVFNRPFPKFGNSQDTPTISTMPMPVMLNHVFDEDEYRYAEFRRQEIWTRSYRISDCDVYQTIYFPGAETSIYRATITGDKFILEYARKPTTVLGFDNQILMNICAAFGINHQNICSDVANTTHQKYGKIIDIDHDLRRSIMAKLTHAHNIYSLGRYATWRNILLDDVYHDIFKIRDLIGLDDYSRRLRLAEEK